MLEVSKASNEVSHAPFEVLRTPDVSAYAFAMSPTPPLDIHALEKKTGFDARTIRRYAERGLIPRPDNAGKSTRYTHEHVVRLLAIRKLYETTARLSVIEAELAKRSFSELEAFVGLAPPVNASEPAPREDAPAKSVAAAVPTASTVPASKGERWVKLPLLPGLELMMRDDATDLVRRIAREIEERYRTSP